jgi:hypothetical protein
MLIPMMRELLSFGGVGIAAWVKRSLIAAEKPDITRIVRSHITLDRT